MSGDNPPNLPLQQMIFRLCADLYSAKTTGPLPACVEQRPLLPVRVRQLRRSGYLLRVDYDVTFNRLRQATHHRRLAFQQEVS
jgi:hypothetical protein